jgi:hypothetical protein
MSKFLRSLAVLGLLVLATSAQAITMHFDTPLGMTGAQEVPAHVTLATGTGTVDYDSISHLLDVYMTWAGLTAASTVSHIHVGPGPGTNGPVAVPLVGLPAAFSGTYAHLFDLTLASTYTGAFIAGAGGGTISGAEAALVAALLDGHAYLNIHDAVFPGGEIRGDLAPAADPIPEPATVLLLGLGAVVALASRRRLRGC